MAWKKAIKSVAANTFSPCTRGLSIESGAAFKNVDAELDIGELPSAVHSAALAMSAALMGSAVDASRRVGMVLFERR
jgi:hypothetical protein